MSDVEYKKEDDVALPNDGDVNHDSIEAAFEQMKAANEADPIVEEPKEETTPEVTTEKAETPKDKKASNSEYDIFDFNRIDDDSVRNDAEARFNRLYGQLKRSDQNQVAQQEHLVHQAEQLEHQAELIEKLMNRFDSSDRDRQLDGLKREAKEARDIGDFDEYDRVQNQIVNLSAENLHAKNMESQKPEKPKQEQKQPAEPGISAYDQQYLAGWAEQKGEDGKSVRPWANDNNHPLAQEALRVTNTLLSDPNLAHIPIEKKMARVDKYIALKMPKKSPKKNTVVGANLTNAKKEKTIELSSEQKHMAANVLYRNLPREEAYKKYAATLKAEHNLGIRI